MDFDYSTGFHVLVWAGIATALLWVGLKVSGDSPKGVRRYLAWPFFGLALFCMFLLVTEMYANMLTPVVRGVISLGQWIRSFF